MEKDEPNQLTLQQGLTHFPHFPGVSKFFFFLHFTITKNKFVFFFKGQGNEQNADSNESLSGKAIPQGTGVAGGAPTLEWHREERRVAPSLSAPEPPRKEMEAA